MDTLTILARESKSQREGNCGLEQQGKLFHAANKYSGMLLFAIIDIDFSQFSRPGGQFPRQRRRGGSRLSVRFDQRSMSWNRQNVIYWTRIKQNFG